MNECSQFAYPFGAPHQVTLSQDRRRLRLVWRDGREDALSIKALRASCRSSDALRARIDGRQANFSPELTIERVELVGAYALNLAFSDGENRGIYPWRFLRELADAQFTPEGN